MEVRMTPARPWSRGLVIAGLVAVLVGTVDPLEGSVVILGGIALMAVGAAVGRSPQRQTLYAALALGAVGVGLMFAFSAVGGFGGNTGRSTWWALTLLPYPIAWLLAIVSAIRLLRVRPANP
jgi:hypothetical protein